MTNDVTTYNTTNSFTIAAAASPQRALVGERLRFSKGRYLIGAGDTAELAAGTVLDCLDTTILWIKFIDGKVVDQRIGYPVAAREELDDQDEADWPTGFDGKPADPWVLQQLLYLVDARTGAEYTFTTSSWGGRAAVDRLVHQVATKQRTHPDAMPTIKLEIGYKKSVKYGAIPAPVFTVISWSGERGDKVVPLSRELDDAIPF
jgi:hypothetical protein